MEGMHVSITIQKNPKYPTASWMYPAAMPGSIKPRNINAVQIEKCAVLCAPSATCIMYSMQAV